MKLLMMIVSFFAAIMNMCVSAAYYIEDNTLCTTMWAIAAVFWFATGIIWMRWWMDE
jgi:hypothetical protein